MAIHKFSLIAEFEYDDENGDYEVPRPAEIERQIHSDLMKTKVEYGLNETHLEIAKGSLHTAFGIVGL